MQLEKGQQIKKELHNAFVERKKVETEIDKIKR